MVDVHLLVKGDNCKLMKARGGRVSRGHQCGPGDFPGAIVNYPPLLQNRAKLGERMILVFTKATCRNFSYVLVHLTSPKYLQICGIFHSDSAKSRIFMVQRTNLFMTYTNDSNDDVAYVNRVNQINLGLATLYIMLEMWKGCSQKFTIWWAIMTKWSSVKEQQWHMKWMFI